MREGSKMKIDKTYNYNMRNDAHFQFHTEFRDLVEKHGAGELKIKPQFDAYLPLYEREDTALKKISRSAITAQIQEADKARNDIYAGMVGTTAAATKHFSEDVRKAASQLKIVFDTYGNAARKSLIEETSAIYNLLQDLSDKYAGDVAALGIGAWAAELETRNKAFETLMKERFDETAARTDIVLKEARMEADAAYLAMRDRLNALALIEGAAAYEPFIKALNAVIAKFNAATHHRGHRNRNLERSANNPTKEVTNEHI
jgi:hypothetical protein